MFRKFSVFFTVTLTLLMFVFGATFLYSRVEVGEEVNTRFETPQPYEGLNGVIWEQEFHWPKAGYIAIHFSHFDLAQGDYVVISSPDGKYSYTY